MFAPPSPPHAVTARRRAATHGLAMTERRGDADASGVPIGKGPGTAGGGREGSRTFYAGYPLRCLLACTFLRYLFFAT
jgi:hypothetical protein